MFDMPFKQKARVTLTSKGQITLPIELRRRWNLHAGDQLDFALEGDRVTVRRLAHPPGMIAGGHERACGTFLVAAREAADAATLQSKMGGVGEGADDK